MSTLSPQVKAVLDQLTLAGDPTVLELSAATGVPRSSVCQYLHTAEVLGLVERLPRHGRCWRINAAGLKAIGRKASRAA